MQYDQHYDVVPGQKYNQVTYQDRIPRNHQEYHVNYQEEHADDNRNYDEQELNTDEIDANEQDFMRWCRENGHVI